MEPFEQQLQNLWRQGGRELAIAFLRRVLNPQMTLQNLQSALQFGDVIPHLGNIRLQEVFDGGSVPGQQAKPALARAATAAPAKARRRRRTAEELAALRVEVEKMLRAEPGSLNTTQVVAALAQSGFEFDTVRVNALMRTLQGEDLVADLGGKPKAWRATAALRRG